METTPSPAKQRIPPALPFDVVLDIVVLVAATSPYPFADLGSISVTCKAMYAMTKEPEVLRHVALEKEDTMNWCDNKRYLTLLKKLAGASNPEACFLSGLMHVFMHKGKQTGLTFLKEAAAAGHKTAAYMLGIVLYGADGTRDAAKRYIRQVEGESCAGIGCETSRTNRECKHCHQVTVLAVVKMREKKMAGSPSRVLRASYNSVCASKGCGLSKAAWPNYKNVFCSDDCRIINECNEFLQIISCYDILRHDAEISKLHSR